MSRGRQWDSHVPLTVTFGPLPLTTFGPVSYDGKNIDLLLPSSFAGPRFAGSNFGRRLAAQQIFIELL